MNDMLLEKKMLACREFAINELARLVVSGDKQALKRYSATDMVREFRELVFGGLRIEGTDHFFDFAKQRKLMTKLAIQAETGDWGEAGAEHHIRRVNLYTTHLAELGGVGKNLAAHIGQAAELHDIGKLFAYAKPSRPWPTHEIDTNHLFWGWEMLHPGVGQRYSLLMAIAARIARFHHEAWNGGGPEGESGRRIPLEARITAIAVFFETYSNPVKIQKGAGWSDDEIFLALTKMAGEDFDPGLVKVFLASFDDFVCLREKDI